MKKPIRIGCFDVMNKIIFEMCFKLDYLTMRKFVARLSEILFPFFGRAGGVRLHICYSMKTHTDENSIILWRDRQDQMIPLHITII